MKKRIFSGLLALAILTTGTAVSAAEPSVSVNKLQLDVTVEYNNPPKKAAIQVLDKSKTKVWYNGEGEVTDGKVIFDTFSLPKSIPTGNYIVRCTPDGTEACEITVSIANIYEKIEAFNTLSETEASDYKDVIGNGVLFGVDATEYQELSGDESKNQIFKLVNEYLAKTDWYVGEEGEYLDEKNAQFAVAFETAMEAAYILVAEDTEKLDDLQYFEVDFSGYYKMLSKKGFLDRMTAAAEDVTEIDVDQVCLAFDEAVLLASVDELDYTTVEDAVEYYEEKEIIELNRTTYNKLNSSNKSKVWVQLKKATLNSCDDISDEFLDITKDLYEEQEDKTGGGRGGSSGGGASSGRTNSVSGRDVASAGEDISNETQNSVGKAVFSDMAGYEWAETAVEVLYSNGIIAGKGGGKFAPADNITREEFVKLIVELLNLPEAESVSFSDVSEDDWCYEYISAATASGIVNGIGDGKFGKGRTITREDMVVILKRAAEFADIDLSAVRNITFADSHEISDYAQDAVSVLSNAGIINGVGVDIFAPLASVTRAEAAKAVYEIYIRMEEGK